MYTDRPILYFPQKKSLPTENHHEIVIIKDTTPVPPLKTNGSPVNYDSIKYRSVAINCATAVFISAQENRSIANFSEMWSNYIIIRQLIDTCPQIKLVPSLERAPFRFDLLWKGPVYIQTDHIMQNSLVDYAFFHLHRYITDTTCDENIITMVPKFINQLQDLFRYNCTIEANKSKDSLTSILETFQNGILTDRAFLNETQQTMIKHHKNLLAPFLKYELI